MENDENKEKKEDMPAPIRVNQKVMDWLYEAQETTRRATGKRASFSTIIDDLIARSENDLGQTPYERQLTYEKSMIQPSHEVSPRAAIAAIQETLEEIKQVIESKGSIDYRKVERACADAIRRLDSEKHGGNLSRIERSGEKSADITDALGKGTGRSHPKRGLA